METIIWIIIWYAVLVAGVFISIYTKTCFFPEEHQKFIREHKILVISVLLVVLVAIVADYWFFKGGNQSDEYNTMIQTWKNMITSNGG